MDNKDWKTKYKPSACTRAPWEYLIPFKDRASVMRQIKQECIDIYGHSMDECPKRLVCLKKECIGRPLPWESPTAKPYLEQLAKTQNIKDGEMFIQTDCSQCPLYDSCKNPCYQVLDFVYRDKVEEPTLYYQGNESALDVLQEEPTTEEPTKLFFNGEDIPWDCLPEKKQQVVKKYLFDNLDFKYIADQLDLNNQARCKYEFYSALNKLSEYAAMRKVLIDNLDTLTDRQQHLIHELYYKNKSYTQLAKELGISKQSIQQTMKRVLLKYGIKWTKFVTKKGNKTIYNVPELFK